MRVVVIIDGGIVSGVLSDGDVEVEVVPIDKDYEDYDQLLDYESELYQDPSLKELDFKSVHFSEELSEGMEIQKETEDHAE